MKKFIDKKYAPIYLLIAGLIVFASAFWYASGRVQLPDQVSEDSEEENQLSVAGGDEMLDSDDVEIFSPTKAITKTPTVTVKPKATFAPSNSPTVTLTVTPSPQPTSTPSNTPTSEPTVTLTPTLSPTPLPTVVVTPTQVITE